MHNSLVLGSSPRSPTLDWVYQKLSQDNELLMVKIVNLGPDPSVVKHVICKSCGAKLEYVPNDVKEYHGHDYSGGPDGRTWIVCPNCNKDVTLSSW